MANPFELDGRGPTERQLLGSGIALIVMTALVAGLLLLKSTGRLESSVRVVAALVNVGDGLPQRSDVKYHGVLVGAVTDVTPAAYGDPNFVHIDLKSEYARAIPSGVTARVVPSNVFAVSSVQLVDSGGGPPIASGPRSPRTPSCRPCCFRPPSASYGTSSLRPGAVARTIRSAFSPR